VKIVHVLLSALKITTYAHPMFPNKSQA